MKIGFLSIALSFISLAHAQTSWPALDVPPPIQDNFNALVDFTKIPPAPVRSNESECPETDTYCNWSCTGCVNGDITVCPNPGDWGLTFDDGPTNYTIPLLDYLNSQNITITFFVVGSRVVEYPEVLKQAYKLGHEIGVHTWSHPYLTTQSNEQVIAELQWTAEIIKATIGVTPAYMRPPYGDIDDRVRSIASQLGYKVVIWDRDTLDWTFTTNPNFNFNWIEDNFTEWVKESCTSGHISLEHDLYNQTATQGPKVVPIVLDAHFSIKPVALCNGDHYPYQNSSTTNSSPTPSNSIMTTADSSMSTAGSSMTTAGSFETTETDASIPNVVDTSSSTTIVDRDFSVVLFVLTFIVSYMVT